MDELLRRAELEAKLQVERAMCPTLAEHHRHQLIEVEHAISNLVEAVKTLTNPGRDCMGSAVARNTHIALASEHLAKLKTLNP